VTDSLQKLMEWYFPEQNHSFSGILCNDDLLLVFSGNNDLSMLWNQFFPKTTCSFCSSGSLELCFQTTVVIFKLNFVLINNSNYQHIKIVI